MESVGEGVVEATASVAERSKRGAKCLPVETVHAIPTQSHGSAQQDGHHVLGSCCCACKSQLRAVGPDRFDGTLLVDGNHRAVVVGESPDLFVRHIWAASCPVVPHWSLASLGVHQRPISTFSFRLFCPPPRLLVAPSP